MASRISLPVKFLGALLIVAAIGGGLYAAGVFEAASPAASSSSVPTVRLSKGEFIKTVNSIGELKAARSYLVMAPYEGKVVKLVTEGTAVEEGDPLLWLDTDDLEDRRRDELVQLQLAEKDLQAAEEEYRLQKIQNEYNLQSELAKVELAEQRLLDAEQRFESEQILVERRISARSKLDEVQLALLQAGVELRNARINLQKTQENLASNMRVRQTNIDKAQLEIQRIERSIKEIDDRLEAAVLRSPAAGEVSYLRMHRSGTLSKVQEGDTVWPRSNLMEIPDRSQMLALIPVNELDIAQIDEGQIAEVRLDALPGRLFYGKVERKSIVPIESQSGRRGSSNSTGPREFEVQVRMDDQEPLFFQGMTASVKIIVDRRENTLQVPLEALTLHDDKIGIFRSGSSGPSFIELEVLQTNDRAAAVEGAVSQEDIVYLRHPRVSSDEARSLGFEALRRVNRTLNQTIELVSDEKVASAAAGATP